MCYSFFVRVLRFVTRQFFSKILVTGAHRRENGPLLIVSNHPNCLLDSLLILSVFERRLSFIAKATLFRHPIMAALLRAASVIPVSRVQDGGSGAERNLEAFRAVDEALRASGAIVIFPEGTSAGTRTLQPLKTGAARMALETLSATEGACPVAIQPVGITYNDIHQFWSDVSVTIGEPIEAKTFLSDYRANGPDAVRKLTELIEERLREVTVDVVDARHARMVEKVRRVYETSEAGVDFHRLRRIAQEVERQVPQLGELVSDVESRIDEYLFLADALPAGARTAEGIEALRLSTLCISPFALIGAVLHYLPYRFTGEFVRLRVSDPAWIASAKFSIGLAAFAVWYLVIAAAVWGFTGSFLTAVGVVFLVGLCGVIAQRFFFRVSLFVLTALWPGRHTPLDVLRVMRDQLIEDLEKLRDARIEPHHEVH